MPSHLILALAIGLILGLSSCRSSGRLAKAFPVRPSPFLIHTEDLAPTDGNHNPFLRQWRNPDEALWEQAAASRRIHLQTVELGHLRPVTRPLSKVADHDAGRRRNVDELAAIVTEEISKNLSASKPSWSVAKGDELPASDLSLELAIVEFNPNTIVGGLARKGINILLWPGAETAISHKLKGSMAIEGRLRLGAEGPVLLEFSDAEQVRSGIILYYHDYTNYSYFRKLCSEWGSQIAEVIDTRAKGTVKDSLPATLLLW